MSFNVSFDLTKGLITNVPQTAIPPGGSSAMFNFNIVDGQLTPRPGLKHFINAEGEAIVHIDHYFAGNSVDDYYLMLVLHRTATDDFIVCAYDLFNSVMLTLESQGTSNPFTFTLPAGSEFASNTYFQSCSYNSNWYIKIPTSPGGLYKFTGRKNLDLIPVTNSNPTYSPIDGQVLFSSASRLFLCATSTAQARVAWSDFLLDNTWNGSGSSGIQDLIDDNEKVLAGLQFEDTLYIFKRMSVYASPIGLGAPTFFEFKKIFTGQGCINPKSIHVWRDKIIFLGNDNVYIISNGTVTPVGDSITTVLKDTIKLLIDYVSPYYPFPSFSLLDPIKGIYYLFLPVSVDALGGNTTTYNMGKVLALNLNTGSWSSFEFQPSYYITGGTSVVDQYWCTRNYLSTLNGDIFDFTEAEFPDYTTPVLLDNTTEFGLAWDSGVFDVATITEGKYLDAVLQKVIFEAPLSPYHVDGHTYDPDYDFGDSVFTPYVLASNNLFDLDYNATEYSPIAQTPENIEVDPPVTNINFITPGLTYRYFKLRITANSIKAPRISKITMVFEPTSAGAY